MKYAVIATILTCIGLIVLGCSISPTFDELITNPNTTPEQFDAAITWEQAKADIANQKRVFSILGCVLGGALVGVGVSVAAMFLSKTLGAMALAGSVSTAILAFAFMTQAKWIAGIGIGVVVVLIIGAMIAGYFKWQESRKDAEVKTKAFGEVVDSMQIAKGNMTDEVKKMVNTIQSNETKELVKLKKGS